MRLLKRITAAAVIAAMILPLAACSGNGEKNSLEKQTLEHVYRAEDIKLPEPIDTIESLTATDTGYSARVGIDSDDGYYYARAEFDSEFNLLEHACFDLDMGDGFNYDPYMSDYCDGNDGRAWGVVNASYLDEKNDYSEYKSFLVKFDDGLKPDIKLPLDSFLGESEDTYIRKLIPYGEGGVLVLMNNRIIVLDSAGNKTCDRELAANDGILYLNGVLTYSGGLLISYYNEAYVPMLCTYVPEKDEFGATIPIGGIKYFNYYPGNGEYDAFCADDSGIYGLRVESKEDPVLLVSYQNSDIMPFMPEVLVADCDASDGTSFIYSAYDEDGFSLKKLTPVPESEQKSKYIISLSGLYIGYDLKMQAARFNRESDEYRIKLRDYAEEIEYGDMSERQNAYEDLVKRFNADVASGNTADIIVNSSSVPFDSYASKGMFEDLYEYIDKDPELSRGDFEQNVLTALETNGKLYRVLPEYQVLTFAAKNKFVGDYVGSLTIENFMKLAESLPEGVEMFQGATRGNMLSAFVSFMYSEFIKDGKADFNDGKFAKLLEFTNTLGDRDIFDTTSSEDMDEEFWNDYDNVYRDERVVMSSLSVYSFDALREQINNTFGSEDISLVGFPSAKGGSAVLADSGSSVSISSKSALKEGAWAFVKMLLSSEFQDEVEYAFPLRTDALEKMMQRQVEESKKNYEDTKESGGSIGGGGSVSYITDDGKVITRSYEDGTDDELVPYLTEESAKTVLDHIRGADLIYNADNEINSIIDEEAQKYFDGQCTSDAAASAVQSRVSLYLGEKSA